MHSKAKHDEIKGLCMTCRHAGGCVYLARAEGPILRCEEFDDSGPARDPSPTVVVPESPGQVAEIQRPEETSKYRGICSTCDNRATCVLPKARKGVWYCEEYS